MEKQVEWFEACLKQAPERADAHFHLALAYDKLGNTQKTFEHAQRAVQLDGSYRSKLQPLIKNSNVARKIGSVVGKVLRSVEMTDGEIEKYADHIAQILGKENLQVDFKTAEGKERIRTFVQDEGRMQRLQEAFHAKDQDRLREVLEESDIGVDVDGVMQRYQRLGGMGF